MPSKSRRRTLAASVFALLLTPFVAAAQQPVDLSLEAALRLARGSNPDFLVRAQSSVNADWAVRSAYASLLPSAGANMSFQYQGEGVPRFGSFTGGDLGLATTPSYYMSGYSLGLTYQLSGSTLLAPSREQANRRATEAGIEAAAFALDARVTQQYLASLRAQDGVRLAQQELERAQDTRRLVAANVAVGRAIPLDVMQADVQVGRAEIALLQSENLQETEQLRLIEMLGVDLEGDIELTSSFPIVELPWTQAELVELATRSHPQIVAAMATVDASDTGVRMARTAYLPTLELTAGRSGFTRQIASDDALLDQARRQSAEQQQQCQLLNQISAGLTTPLAGTPVDCGTFRVTPAQEADLLRRNNVFPFNFTRDPFAMTLRVSLPVFNGLQRERQVEAARVAAQEARHRVRGEELRLRTEVTTAFLNARTAHRTVVLEERSQQLASEQLRLARERYALGASSFLELQEAETTKARADRAHLSAVYAYHESLAALEAAVGRPLRENR